MKCDVSKELISEYVDGCLTPKLMDRLQAHIVGCDDCTRWEQEIRAVSGLLRGLPLGSTSMSFEARLSERLAASRRTPNRTNWLQRITDSLTVRPTVLRPVLALCAAAAVVTGTVLFDRPAPQTVAPGASIAESGLVSHCVQQHRSDVGAQPLADLSAQNLANRSDSAGQTGGYGAAVLPTDTAIPGQDNL